MVALATACCLPLIDKVLSIRNYKLRTTLKDIPEIRTDRPQRGKYNAAKEKDMNKRRKEE